MEHVTPEDGSYGRCYVNKIPEGVISMRRAIRERNYSTRNNHYERCCVHKDGCYGRCWHGRCEMNKNGHHRCLAVMDEVILTRMGISGTRTVPVLEPASDLNIIMPKIQGGEKLSWHTKNAETRGFEKPGPKAHCVGSWQEKSRWLFLKERERDCGSDYFPFHEPHFFLPVGVGPHAKYYIAMEERGGWNKPQNSKVQSNAAFSPHFTTLCFAPIAGLQL